MYYAFSERTTQAHHNATRINFLAFFNPELYAFEGTLAPGPRPKRARLGCGVHYVHFPSEEQSNCGKLHLLLPKIIEVIINFAFKHKKSQYKQ